MMFHPHISQLDVRMTASQMPEDMETQVAVLERNIARGGVNNVQSWTSCDKYGCGTAGGTASHSRVGHQSEIRTAPFESLSQQFAHAAIRPDETHRRLIQSSEVVQGKKEERPRTKHGIILSNPLTHLLPR
jgi:hypothetical protein